MKEPEKKRKSKFRTGDKVIVTTGNDRGHVGEVMKLIKEKIVVRGANIVKRHVKKSEQNPNGGIMEMEKPIHISNVKFCVGEDKGVKLRTRTTKSGSREYWYKDEGKEVALREVKKGS